MIDLTQERDVNTLRQISLLLERENQRLLTKTLQLTAELARLRGVPDPEQLALAELRTLEQRRAQLLTPPPDAPPAAKPRPWSVVELGRSPPSVGRAAVGCGCVPIFIFTGATAHHIAQADLAHQMLDHRFEKSIAGSVHTSRRLKFYGLRIEVIVVPRSHRHMSRRLFGTITSH